MPTSTTASSGPGGRRSPELVQIPLVFNEIAPMVDWLIGTERRMRVDWSVLLRTEDDVQGADIKTKVMKYISDVNKVQFARSRAFRWMRSRWGGLGGRWVRDDPTKDAIYSRWRGLAQCAVGPPPMSWTCRMPAMWFPLALGGCEDVAAIIVPSRADRSGVRSRTTTATARMTTRPGIWARRWSLEVCWLASVAPWG